MIKDCTRCVNCESVRGFMVTCRCSYTEERDGQIWHVQEGKDCHKNQARKCEHYSEEEYDRDEVFAL